MHVPTIQTSSSAPSAHAGIQLEADPASILNISCGWCSLKASQQVQQVKVPDVLRLIHVSVKALQHRSEHEAQLVNRTIPVCLTGAVEILSLPPPLRTHPRLLIISLSARRSGRHHSLVKRSSGQNLHFGCHPRRYSHQRLSNSDLPPSCYIYEPGQVWLLEISLIRQRNNNNSWLQFSTWEPHRTFSLVFARLASVKYHLRHTKNKTGRVFAEGHS